MSEENLMEDLKSYGKEYSASWAQGMKDNTKAWTTSGDRGLNISLNG
jgi:hypothetical protein